jgi:cell wall-associated NlpC family hydrolase
MSAYSWRMRRYRRYGSSGSKGPLIAVAALAALLATGGAKEAGHARAPVRAAAPVAAGSGAAKAIAYARGQLGKPYVYGAPRWSPGAPAPASYDCASLTQWAWAAAGVHIGLTSEQQYAGLRHVPLAQARPGDLLFETGSPIDSPPGHVMLYLGGGWMIEAYATGYPVRITRVRPSAWSEAARP